MSTTLDRIRAFFTIYPSSVELKTKHVPSYQGFNPKAKVSISDLVDHQVFIDEIKVVDENGNVITAVGAMVEDALSGINAEVVSALGVSLQRRFSDDHRNKENNFHTRTPTLPKRIHDKIQVALDAQDVEQLKTYEQSLELMGETNTKEYAQIGVALDELQVSADDGDGAGSDANGDDSGSDSDSEPAVVVEPDPVEVKAGRKGKNGRKSNG